MATRRGLAISEQTARNHVERMYAMNRVTNSFHLPTPENEAFATCAGAQIRWMIKA
jgi:hypothetical protein